MSEKSLQKRYRIADDATFEIEEMLLTKFHVEQHELVRKVIEHAYACGNADGYRECIEDNKRIGVGR